MSSDQASQFTLCAWADRLKRISTRISMHDTGRCIGNVFIERLWQYLKYECVYRHARETSLQARVGIGRWILCLNQQRPHTAHAGQPPAVIYVNTVETDQQVKAIA